MARRPLKKHLSDNAAGKEAQQQRQNDHDRQFLSTKPVGLAVKMIQEFRDQFMWPTKRPLFMRSTLPDLRTMMV